MKYFDRLYGLELGHEGYFANIPGDEGKMTYMGIAQAIFPEWEGWPVIDEYIKLYGEPKNNERINSITLETMVLKHYTEYYYKNNINFINSFSLQYIIFDFAVNSVRTWAKKLQRLLGVEPDGNIGEITIKAINSYPPELLFEDIKKMRIAYYERLAKKPHNLQFLKAWLRRVNSIRYEN